MERFKGTKGKWHINTYPEYSEIAVNCQYGPNTVTICKMDDFFSQDIQLENAALIAAAPDLLAALIVLVDKTEELATIVHLITQEQGEAIKKAKQAINKALGG